MAKTMMITLKTEEGQKICNGKEKTIIDSNCQHQKGGRWSVRLHSIRVSHQKYAIYIYI